MNWKRPYGSAWADLTLTVRPGVAGVAVRGGTAKRLLSIFRAFSCFQVIVTFLAQPLGVFSALVVPECGKSLVCRAAVGTLAQRLHRFRRGSNLLQVRQRSPMRALRAALSRKQISSYSLPVRLRLAAERRRAAARFRKKPGCVGFATIAGISN